MFKLSAVLSVGLVLGAAGCAGPRGPDGEEATSGAGSLVYRALTAHDDHYGHPAMAPADRVKTQQALEAALAGQVLGWPGEGGEQYRIEPLEVDYSDGGICRGFVLRVDDKTLREQRACRRGDGSWAVRPR